MNIIRAGRDLIVNGQYLNATGWKESIEIYKEAVAKTEREQRKTATLRTPRGKGDKCTELIKNLIEDLRQRKVIKNSQVEAVTQFFYYKSLPKDTREDREICSKRIMKFVDKILSQNVKTVTQKIHKERLDRLQKFYHAFDPFAASTIASEVFNLFKNHQELETGLGDKFSKYITAFSDDSLAKGVEFHNYCMEEKNLIPLLQAWTVGNTDRNEGERYRTLRLWAKCLFDLRCIMIRYPSNYPPQKLAVSMNDMNFDPRKAMAPISLDLCLAFNRAGKGIDARALLDSQKMKSKAQDSRSFLQAAKIKFEKMQKGEKLSYNVANHEFDHRDNPLAVLEGTEKSYHLLQLMHTCCLKEISNLCNGDQDVALACHFASIIDQKDGLAAFDELDKHLAALAAAVPQAKIRPEGPQESVAPSASAGAPASENPGQTSAKKKKVRQKLIFQDELPAAATPSGGNSAAPAPAPQSVPAAVTSPRDDKAIQAALARDIAKSNIAVASAPQAALAPVTSSRDDKVVQTVLAANSVPAVNAVQVAAAQAPALQVAPAAAPVPARAPAVQAANFVPAVNAAQKVVAAQAPAPQVAPAAAPVPARTPAVQTVAAANSVPAVNAIRVAAVPVPAPQAAPAAAVAVPKPAQVVPPLVQKIGQPLAKSVNPASNKTRKRDKGIVVWIKNRCNWLMSGIMKFWNWLLRK